MPTNGEGAAATVEWGRLIEAVATRRDRAAFIALFEHFAPRVKTFGLRSGASEATAEELAQDTLLTVWLRADSFVPGSAGAAWIFTIVRNLRIDAPRRMPREDNGQELDIEKETAVEPNLYWGRLTAESQVAALQLEQRVRNAMAQLSNEQLRLIESLFFEDRAQGEIAAAPEVPLGTVKSRSRRAISQLRALLGTCHDDRAPVSVAN
ncbi:MAG: sigma-70 family RNA polymerase sigma factor [Rhodoplanes sp.]